MANNFFRLRRIGQLAVLTLTLVCYTGANSKDSGVNSDERDNLLGSYLAGRYASHQRDVNIAIDYYSKALKKDPQSSILIEQAFLQELKAAKWGEAQETAQKLIKTDKQHYIARLFLGVKAFHEKKYSVARDHFSKVGKSPIAALTTELATAWTFVAEKRGADAIKALSDKRGAEGVRSYRFFHKALIADITNQYRLAGEEYKKLALGSQSLRILHGHARHKASRKDYKGAELLLKPRVDRRGVYPLTEALYKEVKAKKKIDLLITTPEAGLAEVLYGLGDALRREGGMDIALIYLKIGLLLHPTLDEAHDALAEVYERTEKYRQAIATYAKISKSSPLWPRAQIRKAVNYNYLDEVDAAKDLLEKLSAFQPNEIEPLDTLGNLMRSHKRYKEAIVYYDRVIKLIKKPSQEHWVHFYSRGVCYERLNEWDKAEIDLKKANKLDGNQPLVLNYLGYSWVDQNKNLDQAMKLIRKAVRLRPNDGYFVDSLGWAHYRLKNFKDAVTALERAVELKPDDPVINDHLGDAYWRVGRKLEAEYQWSQSLSLKPEDKVRKEIERKLKHGLDGGKDSAKLASEKSKKTIKK